MKLEYIIIGDEFKSIFYSEKIDFTSKKIKSKESYNITISIREDEQNIKKLSEIKSIISAKLKTGTCIIVCDEVSEYYAKKLYPLLHQYENKLRSLIKIAMSDVIIDINKNQKEHINIFEPNVDDKKMKNIEDFTYFEIANFLFHNPVFDIICSESQKKDKGQETFSYKSKNEIINFINNYKSSIWDEYIQPKIENDKIIKDFWNIKECRNKVMHCKAITAEYYETYLKIIRDSIEELDKAIRRNVIIEKTDINVGNIINMINYIQNIDYIKIAENLNKTMNYIANFSFKCEKLFKTNIGNTDIIEDDEKNEKIIEEVLEEEDIEEKLY